MMAPPCSAHRFKRGSGAAFSRIRKAARANRPGPKLSSFSFFNAGRSSGVWSLILTAGGVIANLLLLWKVGRRLAEAVKMRARPLAMADASSA